MTATPSPGAGFGRLLAAFRDRLALTDEELTSVSGLGEQTLMRLMAEEIGPTNVQVFRIAFGGLLSGRRLRVANRQLQSRGSLPIPGRRLGEWSLNGDVALAWANGERLERIDVYFRTFRHFLWAIEAEGMTQHRIATLFGLPGQSDGRLCRAWNGQRTASESLALHVLSAVLLSPAELELLNSLYEWIDPAKMLAIPGKTVAAHANYRLLRHRRRRDDLRWVRPERQQPER